MSEALPRLDGAFDKSSSTGVSRRQIVKAGVWVAPVVVLATATPASAVSPPPAPVLTNLPTPIATHGSGQNWVITAAVNSNISVLVLATATWVRLAGDGKDGGGWSPAPKTGSRTDEETVTPDGVTFEFPTFVKHSTGSTYRITINYSINGVAAGSTFIDF